MHIYCKQNAPGSPMCCHLLCCELMCAHRDAVDKLHGTPQAVELHTLVDVHDPVGGRRATPHPIVQETADACQDDLEHGKAAAKALFGQQVALTCNGNLLDKNPNSTLLLQTLKHQKKQAINQLLNR